MTRRPSRHDPERRPALRAKRRARNGPWLHGPLPVIGLIGGIGAGKSTVAAQLAARGSHVIDADAVGHALLDQKPAAAEVLKKFGTEIAQDDDPEKVDRSKLAPLVFTDPEARAALERILHPRMRHTFEKAIDRTIRRHAAPAIVLDAAVLLEAGWDDLCDLIVFVDAPRPERLQRLRASRGWDDAELARREAAQMPLAAKRGRSDLVITNTGDPDHLDKAIEPLTRRLRAHRVAFFRQRSRDDDARDTSRPAPPPRRQAPGDRRR
jgi:dephospho-CoA kinase